MIRNKTQNMVISGFLIALGIIIARFFHMLPLPVPAWYLCPLHLPVFISSMLCGWKYGVVCGFTLPYISFMISGMPILYPNAIAMSFEMLIYGAVCGFVVEKLSNGNIPRIAVLYIALIIAQFSGRMLGGFITAILLNINGQSYTFNLFFSSYFVLTLPAILIQLIVLPLFVVSIDDALSKINAN